MTIKVVRRKDYLGEKDANDILLKYGKAAVIRAVESAEVPRLENVKDLSTVQNVDLNNLQKIKTNIPTIDKVIGGLVMGQLIVLTGKRGEGKSTFMSQIVCEALEQNETVFIYSGELADYHFKRWLDYQLAGPSSVRGSLNPYGDFEYTLSESALEAITTWYRGRAYIYDNSWIPENENELESLPDTIEKAIKQYGIRLVCIDNLMTAMEAVNDNSQLNLAQSNFVGRLKRIAVKYDVAIILIAHPRKSREDITNDDVSGSSDITNKADVVMSYQRVDGSDTCNGKLFVTKNRLFGKYATGDKAVLLRYDDATKRIFAEGGDNRHYGWENAQPVVEDTDWMI
jgi:twinkle protein